MGSGEKWCAAMPDSTADPALQTPDELYGVECAAPRVNYLVHQVFCPAQNITNYFNEQKLQYCIERKKWELFQLIDCKTGGPGFNLYITITNQNK
jgi:hypothetical protein